MSHDETAFAEFFRESWEPCLKAVAASTGDLLLAEDQVAEAFALPWASWPKVSRRRGWCAPRSIEGRRGGFVAVPGPPETGLDAAVLTALRRLPARQREVIVLRVFLDLEIETTANQLNIAPGTVRAHLSRAVMALRDELAPAKTMEVDPFTTTI